MIEKILREIYDEPEWVIGCADGLFSRKQIRVDYEVRSRNGRCTGSVGWQRVPNGSTTATEGLFPKIGPGQGKMDTDRKSLSGPMTMRG